METKKHPTFKRNLTVLISIATVASLSPFLNLLFFNGRNVLAGRTGLYVPALVVFSAVVYGFYMGNQVTCPTCSNLCERYPDELGRSRRVFCKKCNTLWDLEISYHTESGG